MAPQRTTAPEDPASLSRDRIVEATAGEYRNRQGFDSQFLGARVPVALPAKTERPRDLLTFELDGERTSELKYTHFSLAMSRKRQLCLWSGVNIDGKATRKATRTSWKLDPRIPAAAQTSGNEHDPANDVYGNEPRFARGHMTRREDPIWGSEAEAHLGNEDSMHLTNVVPQMQPFNAGIWNNLEDYALLHARKDLMRISVITGPVLADDDPVHFGVRIPVEFWKVIAFIHDDTGELTATGYVMSQANFFVPDEFVYGRFETYQLAVATVEQKTGLSFGTLGAHDPFKGLDEALLPQLTSPSQIRFRADEP
jgi:endonuclease G, mitochondrial